MRTTLIHISKLQRNPRKFYFFLPSVKMSTEQAFRIESDTMGQIQVPSDKYWGCQTQRSLENFKIGDAREKMPIELIQAFGYLKKAAAIVNLEFGLKENIANAISQAADEVQKLF